MDELDIENLLVLEENEPHEYYGSINGNLDLGGGPNEYWDLILNDSYNFLYNFLNITGDINQDGLLNVQDIIILVNFILGVLDPTDYEFELADINNDNILNILDIVLVVEQIID